MWNIANVTSTSVTIEIENEACHFVDQDYLLSVNGEVKESPKTNIFTIYNLTPATEYHISLAANGKEVACKVATLSDTATLNVKDFGAVGDGITMDTAAIQAAIMAAPKGARVVIPAGTYKILPLFLKSHMTLELLEGATLLAHTDRKDYPILPGKVTRADGSIAYLASWEGDMADCYASIITGISVEDVRIVGQGTIDGNGQNADWWIDCKVKRGAWRPRSLYLVDCDDVVVEGITIKNSPSWTVHPVRSTKLRFINLTLNNPKDSPNTDGIDPESCSGVEIIGVKFSLGDDCIAIKSGKISVPVDMRRPSENIIIRNCLMEYGHGGVVLGSEMSGGINHVFVERCLFRNTDRGLRIKTRRGRGNTAIIDEIYVKNIKMDGVLTPFTLYIGTLNFENIYCENSEVCAGFIYGLPEQMIKELNFKNVFIDFKEDAVPDYPEMLSFQEKIVKSGFIIRNVDKIRLHDVVVKNHIGETLNLDQVTDYLVE